MPDHTQQLEQICRTTWREVYGFAYHLVQNREEAEDVTQETYARLLRHLPRLRPGELGGLLRTIARNIVRDRWRRQRTDWVPLENEDPVGTPSDHDQRLTVQAALNSLPAEQRMVVELRIIHGYSVAEVAARLQTTEASVRSRQYRAMQRLAEILKEG